MPLSTSMAASMTAPAATLATPVLHSQTMAVITPSRRRGFFRPARSEQQVEVPMLSRTQVVELLKESECGSVLTFVDSEPCQQGRGQGSSASGESRRHQLFVSFKYKRNIIHYEYYWVHLKAMSREPRRTIFHAEQKHFDNIVDLLSNFVPMFKNWLGAIVKVANFLDEPVESVDLRMLLRARHHLVLTRRTAITTSVVLCKLHPESNKIHTTGIVFDFKLRRIRDDNGNTLKSFHEEFQKFLGIGHVGHQLLPSPREEDEEDPQWHMGLLEGLEADADAPPEQRLRRLTRLKAQLGQERAQSSNIAKPEALQLMATLLLPQLIHSSAPDFTPRTPGLTRGGDGVAELLFDGSPSTDVQVLMCDILADLCDMNVDLVGPHVWRVCKGYLEESVNWLACLVALGMLTLMSPRLTEYLLYHTDAATRLLHVLQESHQQLVNQKEPYVRGSTPLRSGQPSSSGNSGPRSLGCVAESELRRIPGSMSHYDIPGAVETEALPPRRGRIQSKEQRQMCRVPSFDDFDDRASAQEDTARKDSSNLSARSGDESAASSRPRLPVEQEDPPGVRSARPIRVPPLNLDLAQAQTGQHSAGASTADGSSAPSMTRSSRRLRQNHPREPVPQAPGAKGDCCYEASAAAAGCCRTQKCSSPQGAVQQPTLTSSRSGLLASVAHSLSAPVLGFKSCLVTTPQSAGPVAQQQPTLSRQQLQGIPSSERQCLRRGEQLAEQLGEFSLLADLSELLRHKQEMQINGAVMETIRPASPQKQGSCTTTPRGAPAASIRPPPGSPTFLATAAVKALNSPTKASASASGLRFAARQSAATPPLPGGVLVSGGSGGGSLSGTPMAGPIVNGFGTSPRLSASDGRGRVSFRKVRLQVSLVLERFCACPRRPADLLGPHVPVNRLFEMLSASCSVRSGACSFSLDDDGDVEDSGGSGAGVDGEPRHLKGLLRLQLTPERMQRIGRLQERLHRSTERRRCVCGAASATASALRGVTIEDPCVCVDDALASSLWRLLGMSVRYSEDLHGGRRERGPDSLGNAEDDPAQDEEVVASRWDRVSMPWHTRLHLDTFLKRLAKTMTQTMMQLRQAHCTAVDGVPGMQHRTAFLLRLCCCYLRQCPGRLLAMATWSELSPVLTNVKAWLLSDAANMPGALPATAARLWVAYLELTGLLLRRGVFSGGAHCPAFGEAVLVQLLDFPPTSHFPSESHLATSPAFRARAMTHCTAASAAKVPCEASLDARRCRSQRSLHPPTSSHNSLSSHHGSSSVPYAGAPPRPPGVPVPVPLPPSSPLGEPRSLAVDRPGAVSATGHPTSAKGGELPRSVWTLLPRVLERIFCVDEELNTAGRAKTQFGEEGAEGVRCRVLLFVEALLEFGRAVLVSVRPGFDGASTVAAAEVSAPGTGLSSERQPVRMRPSRDSGIVRAHDLFHSTMAVKADSLASNLLDWLRFLFLPPSGLLCKLAKRLPLSGSPLVPRLVLCERALFRVPAVTETIYCQEASTSDYYVRRHFLAFVRLYNMRRVDGVADSHFVRLCCLHLQTLLAIASLQTEAGLPRRSFFQLSVLDFLAGEIDLEHETTLMRDRFLRVQRQASSRFPLPTLANLDKAAALAGIGQSPATPTAGPILAPAQPLTPQAAQVVQVMQPQPALGRMKSVPKLKLTGLRPSLQGSLAVGAPPPEEPGVGDSLEAASLPAAPPQIAVSPPSAGPPQSGVPKLSFATLAPVADEPGDSGERSTTASPGATGSLDERLAGHGGEITGDGEDKVLRRPPVHIPRILGMQGISGPPGQVEDQGPSGGSPATSRSSPCNGANWSPDGQATPMTTPFSSACGSARKSPLGSAANSERKRLLGISPAALVVAPKKPMLQAIQSSVLPSSGPPSSSSANSTPRSCEESPKAPILPQAPAPLLMPSAAKLVPKLSFSGVRPSLQGCQALGAMPPEEPTPMVVSTAPPQHAPPPMPFSLPPAASTSMAGSWDPREAGNPGVLSPPPPSNSDSDKSSEGGVPDPEVTPKLTPKDRAPEPPVPQNTPAMQSASQVDPEFDSSSDEEDQPCQASLPGLPALPGSIDNSPPLARPVPQRPTALQLPEVDADGPSRPVVPALGVMRRPTAAVPKLSLNLKGLRPSLQGCNGIGAPPPEEPVAAPATVQKANAPPPEPQWPAPPPPLAEDPPATGGEPGMLTPPGSGWQSPMAGPVPMTIGETGDLSCIGLVHQNVFYFEGRHRRRIYEDVELHALMLSLILALLLTPRRGLLDTRYCDQYPDMNRKRNIPFLLSLHLNHSANKVVLPWVFQLVESIERIGGFRLLKLLCESAMHRFMYTNWTRIASGQFGTVYKCTAQLSETGTVAVKQIPKQTNIQDRCVFFDVFSEIACLDSIRFEGNVCHLFDYGVDEGGYWIVMKYYSSTLKKWREALSGGISQNLGAFFAIYKQILKAVNVLHQHGIVHYDLKCENIMIELDRLAQARMHGEDPQQPASEDPTVPRVALGDFGESRVMAPDELDLRNRGTEIVKCPEMLELEKVGKKGGNNYDRRKRIGTNQAADIWSLGCLLFELVTGQFLFQNDDFGVFWARVTGRIEGDGDVVSEANCQLLEECPQLVEFIRYMLVRDPHKRPTIAAAIQRFDAVASETLRQSHGDAAVEEEANEGPMTPSSCSVPHRDSNADSPRSVTCSVGGSSDGRSRTKDSQPERPLVCAAAGDSECYFTKVLADLCILEASEQDLQSAGLAVSSTCPAGAGGSSSSGSGAWGALRSRLAQCAWTHVVDFRGPGSVRLPCQLEVPYTLSLPWASSERGAEEFLRFLPSIFDFLRHAGISRGIVLFVDSHSQDSKAGGRGGGLAVTAVLALVAETYRMAIYDALSYLSSQLLVAALRPDAATALARWQESERHTAWAQCEGTVRLACLCGSCSWHVPTSWLVEPPDRPAAEASIVPWPCWYSGPRLVSCNCSPVASSSPSCCPNSAALGGGGCESYTRWMQKRFGVGMQSVRWLWLPEGVCAAECSDGPGNGVLTQGLADRAEVTGGRPRQEGQVWIQRFRCKSCHVLTHAEVQLGPGGRPRVALVCSHELLRSERAAMGNVHRVASQGCREALPVRRSSSIDASGSLVSPDPSSRAGADAVPHRPPEWLHSACLGDVVLPLAQPGIEVVL